MKSALRSLTLGAAALVAAVAFTPRTDAGVHVGISVGLPVPPLPRPHVLPPPPHVVIGSAPHYGYGDGYRYGDRYAGRGHYGSRYAYGPHGYGHPRGRRPGYVWVDGAWVLPPWPGAVWVGGYYDRHRCWVPGQWRRY